jgi:hypothetical protein
MKRARLLLLLFVPAVIGVSVAAQRQAASDASLEGVWQILEYWPKGAKPVYRPNMGGFWIFTAKHYAVIADDGPSPRPDLGDPSKATADHLRAVWGPFDGNAGTYERSGPDPVQWTGSMSRSVFVGSSSFNKKRMGVEPVGNRVLCGFP